MYSTLKRYATIAVALILTLAITIGTTFAQEEAEAIGETGSDGLMIAVIGIGVLIIFGLGAAMSSQASEEQAAQD